MFRHEIACSVKIEEDYYVIEYEPNSVRQTRDEAIEESKKRFLCWHAEV